MKNWLDAYLTQQKAAMGGITLEGLAPILEVFHEAAKNDRQIFTFANGGSAASSSHLATDLGKGSSDKFTKRFRILSLNDNTAWLTALGNDYSYEDIFVRQLMNYARPRDVALTMSVSGNSPNLVKAFRWAKENGLYTIALVGRKRGQLAEIADHALVIDDEHYGRVEDTHMTIAHLICYAFMEGVVPMT